jgi:electron transfer flavoprotein-quinone oxidoreductase
VKQHFDAIVVGAGPAGCACALTLARAGLQTLVVERGKFAGAKNMWGGAFYGPLLHRMFPDFWEEAPVERFIFRRRLSCLTEDSALTAEFTTSAFQDKPYKGFTLLRAKFDRWFAERAQQAGAILATGLQADDLLRDGERIAGIRAGQDELPSSVVVACDGVNSLLAEKAGLRDTPRPGEMKLGVKEILKLPQELLEQRFHLSGEEGLAWEMLGSFTKGIPGGAFIYTNRDSLSIGAVVQLGSLAKHKIDANQILENFKSHPEVSRYLTGGELLEYSAHLIPTAGLSMMPRLFADGMLVSGDAAALCLVTGWALEGANFAIASGLAAAETVIEAKKKNDYSSKTLSSYPSRLKQSFVLKDLDTFKAAPRFLDNPRIYDLYPSLACDLAARIFTPDGQPKKKIWENLKLSLKGKISPLQIVRDLNKMKGAL